MLLCSLLSKNQLALHQDFQRRYCATFQLKGLQKCCRSKLEVRKKIQHFKLDPTVYWVNWPIACGQYQRQFFSDLQVWPSTVLQPFKTEGWLETAYVHSKWIKIFRETEKWQFFPTYMFIPSYTFICILEYICMTD